MLYLAAGFNGLTVALQPPDKFRLQNDHAPANSLGSQLSPLNGAIKSRQPYLRCAGRLLSRKSFDLSLCCRLRHGLPLLELVTDLTPIIIAGKTANEISTLKTDN